VNFFGQWNLPNYLGKHAAVSVIAEWVHAFTAALLVLTLLAHWGVGIRHHLRHGDRYLHRMLPFTHQK
jgi:cytochrome b561